MTTRSGLHPVYKPKDPSRRYKGLAIVVALHILIGWAIVSGTAKNALVALKKPLEAVVIQEVIIPPPPPPPKPAPNRSDIRVACPTQVQPEMPRRAIQNGIGGVVRAQVLIKEGVVKEVTILTGPSVFHAAVKAAMLQYKCTAESGEITATQEFVFKNE